jgi:glycerophosphoryl diester phosphodiesterase
MAAFKKARETGAPGIELDVHCSATGELVVAHDDTFKRTAPEGANGGGRALEELSLAEIRSIDVGSFFDPRFSGERPPLLEEVLEECCPAMYIDIELKSRKAQGDPLPGLVAEKLKSLGDRTAGAVTVSSFNPFSIRAFKGRCAALGLRIPTAAIWCDDPEVPWMLRRGLGGFLGRADYAKPDNRQVNRFSRFCWAVLEGRPPVPWTIDDPALAERMLRLGCAGIITNRPQDMLPLIRAMNSGGGFQARAEG